MLIPIGVVLKISRLIMYIGLKKYGLGTFFEESLKLTLGAAAFAYMNFD